MEVRKALKKAFIECYSDSTRPGKNYLPLMLGFVGTIAGGTYVVQETIEKNLSSERVAVSGDKQLADLERRLSDLTSFYADARRQADILDELRTKKDLLGEKFFQDLKFHEVYKQQEQKISEMRITYSGMKSNFMDRFYTYTDISETDAGNLLERYTRIFGTDGKKLDMHHLAYLDECQDEEMKGEIDLLGKAGKIQDCAIHAASENKISSNILGSVGGVIGSFSLFLLFSGAAVRLERKMAEEEQENALLAPSGEKVEKIQVKMVTRELPPPPNP